MSIYSRRTCHSSGEYSPHLREIRVASSLMAAAAKHNHECVMRLPLQRSDNFYIGAVVTH